ncbi:peptidase M24, structural domain-containing protein [Xylaria digitata]|nr:peptidase M24, structural domain-containing protein [Xylaria digitata]
MFRVMDILRRFYLARNSSHGSQLRHDRCVLDHISAKIPLANGYFFLSGCPNKLYQDCDLLIPFRQRRAFMYMSGVNIADCHLLYEVDSDRLTLFLPPADPDNILWEGTPLTLEEALATYDVDAVLQNIALNATLESIRHHEYEIALLQKANDISSAAHKAVMKVVGKSQNETEIEGVFLGECTKRGARIQAYPSIVASGRTAAMMHPESNSQSFYAGGKRKDVLLIDAGAEWECYGADITRTLPISGKFTKESREIYEIVLKMQEGCIAVLKEGVLWNDVHILAHKIAIDGLLSLGIMRGDRDEILGLGK